MCRQLVTRVPDVGFSGWCIVTKASGVFHGPRFAITRHRFNLTVVKESLGRILSSSKFSSYFFFTYESSRKHEVRKGSSEEGEKKRADVNSGGSRKKNVLVGRNFEETGKDSLQIIGEFCNLLRYSLLCMARKDLQEL